MATIDLSQLVTAGMKAEAARTAHARLFRAAIQDHVDAVARSRNYDSGVSLASYAASGNQSWAAEAAAFVAWRDAVWARAHAELATMAAYGRELARIEDFIVQLPVVKWPDLAG